MPAPLRTTRGQWVTQGLSALADGGPDAVRVEAVAAAMGVTKGGFYGHFPDRPTFLTALLEEWERRAVDETLSRVAEAGGDARERIVRAGRLTFADDLLGIDLAVRDWARRDASVATRLRRVDGRRLQHLREQLATFVDDPDDVEARATLCLTLAIGQHFISTVRRDRAVELAIRHLLT